MANSPLTYGPKVSSGKSLPDGITPYMVIRHEEANRMAARTSGRVSVTDPDYGADPTGAVDSGAAINACMAAVSAAGGGTVYFPGGTYLTSVLLALPYNVSLFLEPDATIKATAAMEAVFQSPLTSLIEDRVFRGGKILCNALANVGIDLQWAKSNHINEVCVEDFLVAGYRLGQTQANGAGGNSYENRVTNSRTHRRVASVVANSIGLHLRGSTDNQISDCVFIGGETGVQIDSGSGGNQLSQVHCWVNLGRMKYGFNDLGNSNHFCECYADTPSIYGFWLQGNNTSIIGGFHYNNNQVGDDNVAIAVRFENASPTASVVGLDIRGQDNTHRIAADFSFNSSSLNVNLYANYTSNVVTTNGPQASAAAKFNGGLTTRGFTLFNAAGQNRDAIWQTSSGGAGLGSRWIGRCTNEAESGGNAGSNFQLLAVHDDGSTIVQLMKATRNGALAFYTASPVAQQAVTGSKGANAALTSLIAALVALGLVTDSTT